MSKGKFLVFFVILALCLTSVANADVLKFGSRGNEVLEVQQRLKTLGYFDGNSTGIFGSATRAAVRQYQITNGFIGTGEIDQALLGRILASTAVTPAAPAVVDKLSADEIKQSQTILSQLGLYTGKVDGLAGPKTSAAVKSFQADVGIKADGELNRFIYEKLLEVESKANSSNKITITSRGDGPDRKEVEAAIKQAVEIELLDWWTEANKVFYLGAIANVIDVRTGKSFKVVRTYGTNHADCEAYSKEDSAVIKEIWGGSWSWERRPIIVEIDDRRLAASMSAMPHAGLDKEPEGATVDNRSAGYGRGYNLDKIKDNGMDGHFDIHFLNSRTHGTNVVNDAHQKAIMEAAEKK